MKKRDQQLGLTLVELLLVLVLASFLLLGVTSVLVSNLQAAKVSKDMGHTAESGGFGLYLLTRYLRYSGYKNFYLQDFLSTSENIVHLCTTTSEKDCSLNDAGISGYKADSDALAIEYDVPLSGASGSVTTYRTCNGTNIPIASPIRIREYFFLDDSDILRCNSFNADTNTALGTSNQPLMPGVAMFQVQYGLANDADNISIERYENAQAATVQENFDEQLRSIRIMLLVRSNEDDSTSTVARDFRFADMDDTLTVANQSYRVYNTTIAVHNAASGRIRQ